jgi:hypothetical protein
VVDEPAHHRVATERTGQRHPTARDLLGHQRVALRGGARLAERCRHRHAVHAELLHLLDERLGVGVGVLEVPYDGPDLLVDEPPHHVDERQLLFRHGHGILQSTVTPATVAMPL